LNFKGLVAAWWSCFDPWKVSRKLFHVSFNSLLGLMERFNYITKKLIKLLQLANDFNGLTSVLGVWQYPNVLFGPDWLNL